MVERLLVMRLKKMGCANIFLLLYTTTEDAFNSMVVIYLFVYLQLISLYFGKTKHQIRNMIAKQKALNFPHTFILTFTKINFLCVSFFAN
jgi:hypothetical protein